MSARPRLPWIVATLTISLASGTGAVVVADAVLSETPATVVDAPRIVPVVKSPPRVEPARSAPVAPRICQATWSVHFTHGSATPRPDLRDRLAPAVAFAAEHATATVFVDGHADPSGDELGNVVLSKRRASRVASALRASGIAADRIVERAFGAYVPEKADTELRRVRVTVKEPDCKEEIR